VHTKLRYPQKTVRILNTRKTAPAPLGRGTWWKVGFSSCAGHIIANSNKTGEKIRSRGTFISGKN
jgi:hypothetical protein